MLIDKLFLNFFQLRRAEIIKAAYVRRVYRRAANSLLIL